MDGYRRPSKKGYYQKHFHVHTILLIIIMAAAAAEADTGRDSAERGAADCRRAVTCAQCASARACSWSLRRQTCAGSSETSENLRVHDAAACPSFVAVNRFAAAGDPWFAYALRMANAPPGFAEYLRGAGVRCDVAGEELEAGVSGDTIACANASAAALWRRYEDEDDGDGDGDGDRGADDGGGRVIVRHARVTFAGGAVTLRPDRVADGYFAASRRADCGRDAWDAACVTCARHDAAGTEYFVRCSGRNRCTGLFEYRDAWPRRPRRRPRGPADAPLLCDRDVRVRAVQPASAPWTGGTTLRVTVRDRGVLAEKAAVSVTVAGRACADPQVTVAAAADVGGGGADDSVIACVVPPAAADGPVGRPDGPDGQQRADAAVRVRYALNRTLELAAADGSFRYEYPDVAAVERVVRYGPPPGHDGTAEWTARGALLAAGRRACLYAGDAEIACDARAPATVGRIACAADADAAADRLTVEFDGGLRVHAVLRPRWTVHVGEPAADAGQSFRALASGGTALAVRGRRLLYAAAVRFYAASAGAVDDERYGACRVLDDTRATCAAPRLDGAGGVAVERVGLLMEFAGRPDFRAPADGASYRACLDPAFVDFETDAASGTVTVRSDGGGGGDGTCGSDVGYTADDVTVTLQGPADAAPCDVTAVDADRIVCASPSETLARVRSVVVAVGERLRVRVDAARGSADGGGTAVTSGFAHAHRWTVLCVALVAVLAGVAAQLGLMRLRARRLQERKAAAAAAAAAAVGRRDSDCSVPLALGSQCSSVDLTV